MRILHISALPVWSMDGKGGMPSLRETLKGHIVAGNKIELVLPKYDPFSDDLNPLFVPEQQELIPSFAACRWLPLFKKLRIKARTIGKNEELPYCLRWMLNVFMFLALTVSLGLQSRRVCRKGFRPQLVYAHNQYAALAGFLIGRAGKVPNITRLYGTFLAGLMNKPLVAFRYPTAVAGFLIPSALLICANDGTRGDEVAKKLGIPERRFRFWQNGIEPPTHMPRMSRESLATKYRGLRLESKWVISCSRLSYWKRIDRIIKALKVCQTEGVDCQLVIAGDGPEKQNLHKLSMDLNISEYIVWLGAVAHDEIWALMNNSDVFMITNDVTNRCNPLYEAAWAGLPVVSIYDSSTSDLLRHGENALLAEKDNEDSLGRCLIEICKNDLLKQKLCNAQKELSKTFWTWNERMKIEVEELEKLVLSQKPRK